MNPVRAVFDCNVFVQAMLSDRGPPFPCFGAVRRGQAELFVREYVLEEVREMPAHPDLRRFRHFTDEKVESFLDGLRPLLRMIYVVPEIFRGCRDQDDNHYIDLAVAAEASLVVSKDRDLLDLMDPSRIAGREFSLDFPSLRVLDPTAFLAHLAGIVKS